eukprot:4549422-Pleurochrysis_carterae.AAC.1
MLALPYPIDSLSRYCQQAWLIPARFPTICGGVRVSRSIRRPASRFCRLLGSVRRPVCAAESGGCGACAQESGLGQNMVVGPNGLLIAKAPRREGERAERGVVVTEEEESRRRRQT